ncbi:MAG: class I SAM-dependent methyltransferase [Bacteroidota bacterium]
MEKLIQCPVCYSEQYNPVLNCTDFTTTQEQFSISECSSCSLRFTNPRPGISESIRYYQSSDYISHTDSSKGLLNKVYQLARNYMISAKYNSTVKKYRSSTLLDYGCGTGDFLKYCIDKKIDATGLEIDENARKIAIGKGCQNVFQPDYLANIKDQSVDIITLWHVLEHIHELHPTIKQFKRILASNGTLVIAVPNYQAYDASYYNQHWAAYDVPRHLYHFNVDSMTRLMNDEGFKLIETKSMRLDPFYISLLSNKYKSGSMNPIKACCVGMVTTIKTLFNIKNSSSIIYIFKNQ